MLIANATRGGSARSRANPSELQARSWRRASKSPGSRARSRIETTSNDTAGVNVLRSAPTHADRECGKIAIEQTPTRLRISSEAKCPIVRGQQSVALKLPRRVDPSPPEHRRPRPASARTDGMVRPREHCRACHRRRVTRRLDELSRRRPEHGASPLGRRTRHPRQQRHRRPRSPRSAQRCGRDLTREESGRCHPQPTSRMSAAPAATTHDHQAVIGSGGARVRHRERR